jgi:hypothetical protein
MKLESSLRAAFMAEAKAIDRPASQLVREFMRAFVEHRRGSQAATDVRGLASRGSEDPKPAEPISQPAEGPVAQPSPPELPRKTVLEEPRSLMDRILGGHIRA